MRMQRAVGAIRGLVNREGIESAIAGIQALADATERYCGFTGHEIRTNKSAVQMMLWLETKTGEKLLPKAELPRLFLRRWKPGKVPWSVELGEPELFPVKGPKDELRHLGHTETYLGRAPRAKKLLRASKLQIHQNFSAP